MTLFIIAPLRRGPFKDAFLFECTHTRARAHAHTHTHTTKRGGGALTNTTQHLLDVGRRRRRRRRRRGERGGGDVAGDAAHRSPGPRRQRTALGRRVGRAGCRDLRSFQLIKGAPRPLQAGETPAPRPRPAGPVRAAARARRRRGPRRARA